MTSFELAEDEILDRHEPEWRAQGYQVVRRPRRDTLPAFLQRYIPDAILVGRSPNVVVEVLRKGQSQVERKVRDLNALLAGHDDWRLEVLYAGDEADQLPDVPAEKLEESIERVRSLAPINPGGALLLLWATLEAVVRRLEPTRTRRPQSPGRVIELLAGDGFILPSDADRLRETVRWRNRLVHGDLNVAPSEAQILSAIDIATSLIDLVKKHEVGAHS